MKKTMAGIALLAALPGPALAEGDAVQVYGRLNLALESMHLGGATRRDEDSSPRLSNYRSVIGFRGAEKIGADVRLIFQIEGTLAPDTGAGALAARDTRVGLEGRWGTLFGGNWTTPYTSATSSLDPFYPTTAGYMSIMGNGSAASASNVSDTTAFDRRQQNSLHYWTPDWHGWSLRLARGLNEESPASGAKPSLGSGAVVFERGPLYATLAHERHRAYRGPGLDDRASKLAAAYRFGTVRLAAAVEQLHYETPGGDLERRAYYLALTQQIGAHGLRLGVAKARDGKGSASERLGFIKAGRNTGAVHATLGYDYSLSKRSSLFAFYTYLRNDAQGVHDFAINGLDADAGARASGTSLGIRHAF